MVSRVVADFALRENLSIAAAGLCGIGEAGGEIRANKALAGHARGLFRGLVHVGDFAVGTDHYQRIETDFDQAAGIEGGPSVRSARFRSVTSRVTVEIPTICPKASLMGDKLRETRIFCPSFLTRSVSRAVMLSLRLTCSTIPALGQPIGRDHHGDVALPTASAAG